MGELGEVWREVKKQAAEKRASNRASSLERLKIAGIEFKVHNNGAHLVVYGPRGVVDFWPGTGRYIIRGSGDTGRGVRAVLHFCRGADDE